ncbi:MULTISPECIES: hypothetical protein [unclassified Moorena]|uniref:hypothetical protein n=1 Tax=unclassified Moorena TaxID=2683338 RepID=UPI0025F837F0|nr:MULTISPECIES: hypothetical protein [unclassified Moorena]
MAAQHGGLYQDKALQGYISQVGERIVKKSAASGSPYPFEFYLLSDPNPSNRIEQLQSLIAKTYPNGIPANLQEGREQFARNVKGSR